MATFTRRESILRELKSALEGISKANGYFNNLGAFGVKRVMEAPDKVDEGDRPAICFHPNIQAPMVGHPFQYYVTTLKVKILGYQTRGLSVENGAQQDSLNKLLADIMKAVTHEDNFFMGGYATSTRVTGAHTDEGSLNGEVVSVCRLDVEIDYDHPSGEL